MSGSNVLPPLVRASHLWNGPIGANKNCNQNEIRGPRNIFHLPTGQPLRFEPNDQSQNAMALHGWQGASARCFSLHDIQKAMQQEISPRNPPIVNIKTNPPSCRVCQSLQNSPMPLCPCVFFVSLLPCDVNPALPSLPPTRSSKDFPY